MSIRLKRGCQATTEDISPNLIGGAEIEFIDKDEGLKRVQESEYVSMEQ